jgi:hypothetical protein
MHALVPNSFQKGRHLFYFAHRPFFISGLEPFLDETFLGKHLFGFLLIGRGDFCFPCTVGFFCATETGVYTVGGLLIACFSKVSPLSIKWQLSAREAEWTVHKLCDRQRLVYFRGYQIGNPRPGHLRLHPFFASISYS